MASGVLNYGPEGLFPVMASLTEFKGLKHTTVLGLTWLNSCGGLTELKWLKQTTVLLILTWRTFLQRWVQMRHIWETRLRRRRQSRSPACHGSVPPLVCDG